MPRCRAVAGKSASPVTGRVELFFQPPVGCEISFLRPVFSRRRVGGDDRKRTGGGMPISGMLEMRFEVDLRQRFAGSIHAIFSERAGPGWGLSLPRSCSKATPLGFSRGHGSLKEGSNILLRTEISFRAVPYFAAARVLDAASGLRRRIQTFKTCGVGRWVIILPVSPFKSAPFRNVTESLPGDQ